MIYKGCLRLLDIETPLKTPPLASSIIESNPPNVIVPLVS